MTEPGSETRFVPSRERAERALKRGRSIGNIADEVAAEVTEKVLRSLPALIREAVTAELDRRAAPPDEGRNFVQRTLSGPATAEELWADHAPVPVPPPAPGSPCGPDCWHRTRDGEGSVCAPDESGRCPKCGRSAADRAVGTTVEPLPDGPAAPAYHQRTFTALAQSDPEEQTEREAEHG